MVTETHEEHYRQEKRGRPGKDTRYRRITRIRHHVGWIVVRLIGSSAKAVLTVVIRPSDHAGVTVWLARGADLCAYEHGKEGTQ